MLGLLLLGAAAACTTADAPEPAPTTSAASPSEPVSEVAADGSPVRGWRTEVWREVAVSVPAAWGSGVAPVALDDGLATCGDAPDQGGWVGRPVQVSDLCTPLDGAPVPTQPSVWLGADLEPGTTDLGDGWVRRTVAVLGTTVTVTSDDEAVRARVLGSLRPQRLCPTTMDVLPRTSYAWTVEGPGSLRRSWLCAYRAGQDGQDGQDGQAGGAYLALARAGVSDRVLERARDVAGIYGRRPTTCRRGVGAPPAGEVVVVSARSRDTYARPGAPLLVQDVVLDLSCAKDRAVVRSFREPALASVLSSLAGPVG
ncbi:hypothetical protein [Nocardioides bruguierae]|uniref:hypothetical protein n=1 Tax=Nocardioides bruguierae TaxID=2945102 RepID=UPI00201FB824|nr:hypothetical protein [Nocardioides bruguierae]MCL8024744.1 hypothetical protein [Nocardioides bruguierae]